MSHSMKRPQRNETVCPRIVFMSRGAEASDLPPGPGAICIFSAGPRGGGTPGFLPFLERCNKQRLGGYSRCINTLPGTSPRAWEPRTVPSLHTSLLPFPPVTFPCRRTRTPGDGQPISGPLPPGPSSSSCSTDKLAVAVTESSLSGIAVSGPIIVLHSISRRCLRSGDFLL